MIVVPHIPFLLPGCAVDGVQMQETTLIFAAHMIGISASCPRCATAPTRVHSTYTRTPRDVPVCGQPLRVRLRVRRFFCDVPNCPQRTFAERLPELLPRYAQRTARLTQSLSVLGFALGGLAGARTTRRLVFPTSRDTLLRVVRGTVPAPAPTPRVLGVDDVAFQKGRGYGSLLVDLEQHRPIDVLPNRRAETLAAWLRDHPSIDIIARDRSTEYACGVALGAPPGASDCGSLAYVKKSARGVGTHAEPAPCGIGVDTAPRRQPGCMPHEWIT